MDWWPPSKCDYGYCSWYNNSLKNIDLENKMLQNAVLEFQGKVHLRLGGSLGDFVVYDIGEYDKDLYCTYQDFSEPTNETHAGYELFSGCLKMDRWDALNEFCVKANCDIIFGVNALYGRNLPGPCPEGTNCRFKDTTGFDPCCTNWTGLWNSSNAESFIRYTHNKGYNVHAWELGNELVGSKGIDSHINVSDYLQDWSQFLGLLNDVYYLEGRPKVVVPDTTWMTDWFNEFLELLNEEEKPDIVTHHLYSLGPGSDPNVWTKTLNATYLDQIIPLAAEVQRTLSKSAPSAKIYIGEAGGAYNSGRDNVTNSFNSGFWYLDQMGIFASYGHGAYCRQTLIGGFYSLLDAFTYEPNPDYYNLLLWQRLMSTTVLKTTAASGDGNLRAYAHCTRDVPGAVTILLINLSNVTQYEIDDIDLVGSRGNIMSYGARNEYLISSASLSTNMSDILQSKKVLLNGNLLEVYGDYEIPALDPVVIEKQYTIDLKPLTYGFFVFPDARISLCLES